MITILQVGLIGILVVGALLAAAYLGSRRKGGVTFKQAVLIIAVCVLLWVPMTIFIIWFSDRVSPRQFGAIGAVNMVVGLTILAFAWRKWIRNVK